MSRLLAAVLILLPLAACGPPPDYSSMDPETRAMMAQAIVNSYHPIYIPPVPPVVQYYAAPAVQQPTNCTTDYLRDTYGRAISSYTTCN